MAAARKKKAVAAKPRPLDAALCEQAFQLRMKSAGERHGVTALEFRVAALEKLVTALIDAR